MKELRFALGYMPHRLWGNILQAQFLEKDSGSEFYIAKEFIQNDRSTAAYKRLSPMQLEALGLIDAYSDRAIHRLFSKKGTVKQFQDNISPEMIEDHVRPYIEKYLLAILEIARDNRFPVYVKEKSNSNIFPEDFLNIQKHPATPVFRFTYGERLSYVMQLHHQGKKLSLQEQHVEVVCNHPAVIIIDDQALLSR